MKKKNGKNSALYFAEMQLGTFKTYSFLLIITNNKDSLNLPMMYMKIRALLNPTREISTGCQSDI